MNDNKIIDGKLISSQIREKIKYFGNKLIEKTGKKPGLAVVLVGENPASKVYVKNKIDKNVLIKLRGFDKKSLTEQGMKECAKKNKDGGYVHYSSQVAFGQ